jgi:phage terminase large subunit GpA-like protein
LYYSVAGVSPDFTGDVVLYGTWPQQAQTLFTRNNAKITLQDLYPGDVEQSIEKGLTELVGQLMTRTWLSADGMSIPMGCLCIDAGYKPRVVDKVIRTMGLADRVIGTKGVGIQAKSRPISEWNLKDSPRVGPSEDVRWFYRHSSGGVWRVEFDTNYFKSFGAARLTQQQGPGIWKLFGTHLTSHLLYSSHLCGERVTEDVGNGRTVHVWSPIVGSENHYWDCYIGCNLAASLLGCRLPDSTSIEQFQRPPQSDQQTAQNSYYQSGFSSQSQNRNGDRPFFVTAR